ncbi:MAG TPA: hypothetical protein DDZ51_00520 [Planctomycetaceae bacterium]|nr:hypothetical protein [Planctomycetaceae bacterium]
MPPHPEHAPPRSFDPEFDGGITHRIDLPHAANLLPQTHVVPQSAVRRPANVENGVATSFQASIYERASTEARHLGTSVERRLGTDDSAPYLDNRLVGIAHAEDLLDYIQRLSEDLDARSAKLNADIAMQERRERAFRLWAQQRSEDLRSQREEFEREHQRLKTQARRIALTNNDPSQTNWFQRTTDQG